MDKKSAQGEKKSKISYVDRKEMAYGSLNYM